MAKNRFRVPSIAGPLVAGIALAARVTPARADALRAHTQHHATGPGPAVVAAGVVVAMVVAGLVLAGFLCGPRVVRRLRLAKLAVASIFAATVVLGVGVVPAYARAYYSESMLYRTPNFECTRGHAEVNDDTRGGRIWSQTTSFIYDPSYQIPCYDLNYLGPFSLVVREDLYVSHYWGAPWQQCNQGPTYYNTGRAAHLTTGWNFNSACGWAYYADVGLFVVINGGSWNGAWMASPGSPMPL